MPAHGLAVPAQQEKDRRNTIKYTKKHIREADQKYHLKDYRCAESRQNGDCVKDKFKRCQANPPCGRVHLVGQKKPKHSQASKYYMLQKQVNPATGEKIFTMSPVDDWYEFQKKRNIKSRMTSEQYDNRSLKMGGKLAKFETHLSNHKKGFESAASRTGAWSDKMEQRQGAENADARTDQMQSELKITAKLTTDEKEKAEIQKMQNTMGDMGGFTVKKEVKLRASMKLAADENPDLEEFENETTDFFAADSDDELAGQGPAKDGGESIFAAPTTYQPCLHPPPTKRRGLLAPVPSDSLWRLQTKIKAAWCLVAWLRRCGHLLRPLLAVCVAAHWRPCTL